MESGRVKWFNKQKGYGFISPDKGNRDIFVHISAVEKSRITNLDEGIRVLYDVDTDRGKISAVNLKLA